MGYSDWGVRPNPKIPATGCLRPARRDAVSFAGFPRRATGYDFLRLCGSPHPPIPSEPNEIAPSNVWGPRAPARPINWVWLIAVAILALAIGSMLHRAVSGPARIAIGLQVVSRGKQLEIHWNHDATPIRNAAKGVMRISDGGVQEVMEFDATQLRDGTVAYSPTSNDVTVRLEVNSVDGTTSSESMRSVAIP